MSDQTNIIEKSKKPPTEVQPFNSIAFILAYEMEELDQDEIIAGFQDLINSGLAWRLQGSYGRTALCLIENGHCTA